MSGQELATVSCPKTVADVQRAHLVQLSNVRPVGHSAVQLSSVRVLDSELSRTRTLLDWPLSVWLAIRLWPVAMTVLAIAVLVLSN